MEPTTIAALASAAGGLGRMFTGGVKQTTQVSQSQTVQLNPMISIMTGSPEGKQLWEAQPTLYAPHSPTQTVTNPEQFTPVPSIPGYTATPVPSAVAALPIRSDVSKGPSLLPDTIAGIPTFVWIIGGVGILAVVWLT
jgi:hypothetical protein